MEFIKEDGNPHPEPERIISELVELDYIETENDENVFFLTTCGYDYIEELNTNRKKESYNRNQTQTDNFTVFVNRIGEKNFKKYIFIWLISFGFFVALYKFFFPESLEDKNSEMKIILSNETINKIEKQIEEKMDSLKLDSLK